MAFKSPKSARAKGGRFESVVAKDLAKATGIEDTRKQPGSGAIDGFPGDVVLDPRGWAMQIECKHHKSISGYDRLERARLTADGVMVDTPAGVFVWLDDAFFLDLMARCYGRGGKGELCPNLVTLKTGTPFKTFNNWIKGCSALVVKPNHNPPRWYLPMNVFWAAYSYAARAEFAEVDA